MEDIDPEVRYFITIDMDSSYWQILVEPEAHARLAFLTPKGKKRWTVMPMGALNSAPTFVSMMLTLQELWEGLAKEHDIQHCGAKVIINDVLFMGGTHTPC